MKLEMYENIKKKKKKKKKEKKNKKNINFTMIVPVSLCINMGYIEKLERSL